MLQRGERLGASVQEGHVVDAVAQLAPVAARHRLIVTHGNGPQVGLLALESSNDPTLEAPFPLDTLGAETEGMIGYWIARAQRNALPAREAGALITQTVVGADDPGFADPTKFVGRGYDEAEARRLAEVGGWTIRQDGERWRRVVASPEPTEVVELATIETLIASDTIVVCAGGGGVPVVRDAVGHLGGVEAVIDKDLATSLLARLVGADLLLFLTDVPNVYCDFATPLQSALSRVTAADLRRIPFPAGSMGPKVEAACRFVEATGARAAIGSLGDVQGLLAGTSGTSVVAS